jgi:hypothetical protein
MSILQAEVSQQQNTELPAAVAAEIKSRVKSCIQARDILDAALLAGKMGGPGPYLAVFRVLLENAFYTNDSKFGWVRHDRCGIKTLAVLTGYSEVTVRRALDDLEGASFISRRVRPKRGGGRHADEIQVTWHAIHAEAITESASSSESASDDTESASEGPEAITESASYIPRKGLEENKDEEPLRGSAAGPPGKTQDHPQAPPPAVPGDQADDSANAEVAAQENRRTRGQNKKWRALQDLHASQARINGHLGQSLTQDEREIALKQAQAKYDDIIGQIEAEQQEQQAAGISTPGGLCKTPRNN